MERLLGLILMSSLFVGCGLDLKVNSDLTTPLNKEVTIASPTPGQVFNDNKASSLKVSGLCSSLQSEDFIIVNLRENIKVDCSSQNEWSLDIPWQRIPEGQNTITIHNSSGQLIKSLNFEKSFMPDHVIFNKRVKKISSYNQIDSSPYHNKSEAIAYVSDEYCIVLGCSAKNIVLRIKQDNYETAHFVTSSLTKSFSWPRVVQVSENQLRVFYIADRSNNDSRNVVYKDFNLANKTFTSEKSLTNFGPNEMLNSLQLEQSKEGEIFLSYASKEYCAQNACDLFRAVVRSSKDNYQSRKYFGQESTCDVNMVRTGLRDNTQDFYLFYNFERNTGNCTSWQNYFNYSVHDGDQWSAPTSFTNGRNPGSAHFAIDNFGEIFVFHHSTWHAGCSNWALYYGSSQDNFASVNMVPGSCAYSHSYPNEHHRPSSQVKNDGHIYLLSARRGAPTPADFSHHFFISDSSNDYATPYIFYENDFSNWTPSLSLSQDANSLVANVMIGSGSKSGLNQFRINKDFSATTSHLIEGPANNFIKTVALDDGEIGFVGQSSEYCETLGSCENSNFYLQNIFGTEKTWLTKKTDNTIEISSPHYLSRPGDTDVFIYASNEKNSKFMGSRFSTSSDNFTVSTDFASIDANTLPVISTIGLDDSGTVYTAGSMGDAYLFDSTDNFSSYTLINDGNLGSSPGPGAVRHDGEYVLAYGSNGGGWRGRFRWSLDSYTSDQYVSSDGRIKYGGWTPLWRPDDGLDVFLLTDSNSDGRVDISVLDSADGFSSLSPLIAFTDQSICRSFTPGSSAGTPFLQAKYDDLGRLNILYSARTDSDPACYLYLKRSDDWNKSWKIPTTQGVSLEPDGLFLRPDDAPIVCAKSLSDYYCMDLSLIEPISD